MIDGVESCCHLRFRHVQTLFWVQPALTRTWGQPMFLKTWAFSTRDMNSSYTNGPIRLLQEADEVKHPKRCESWRNTEERYCGSHWCKEHQDDLKHIVGYCTVGVICLNMFLLCLYQYLFVTSAIQVPMCWGFPSLRSWLVYRTTSDKMEPVQQLSATWGKKLGLLDSRRYTWWTSRSVTVTAFSLKSA